MAPGFRLTRASTGRWRNAHRGGPAPGSPPRPAPHVLLRSTGRGKRTSRPRLSEERGTSCKTPSCQWRHRARIPKRRSPCRPGTAGAASGGRQATRRSDPNPLVPRQTCRLGLHMPGHIGPLALSPNFVGSGVSYSGSWGKQASQVGRTRVWIFFLLRRHWDPGGMGQGRTGAGVGAGGQTGCVDWGPEVAGVPPPAPRHRHAAGQCSSCPWNFASNGLPFTVVPDVVRMTYTCTTSVDCFIEPPFGHFWHHGWLFECFN